MGFGSQSGQVGFGIQVSKGVAVPATRFARLRGGSLGGDRSLMIPDPEIGGNRDIPGAYLGPVSYSGDLEFYPRAQMLAMLMYAALGSKASTSVVGPPVVGTHVITPADVSPWMTVEERISNQFESFQYVDAKVNTLRLEAEASGYLMGSAGLIAISQTSGFTEQVSPEWDTTPMMVGGQVTVEFGGNPLPARSFNFEVNNNMETDDFRLGSLVLGDIVEKRREFKLGLSYRPTDADLYKAAMYGDTGLTAPQAGPAYEGSVSIHIESFETIGDVVAGTPFSIDIDIPHCVVAPFKVNPSGDDVLTNDLELTPIRPANATPIVTVTIKNDLATVS